MVKKKELQHSKYFERSFSASKRVAQGLSHTLTQADTVLLGKTSTVRVVVDGDTQGFHNGNSQLVGADTSRSAKGKGGPGIILPDVESGVSADPIATTLGYNYHAIAHRKFSPNSYKLFGGFGSNVSLTKVANKYSFGATADLSSYSSNLYLMFECARVERLMIAAFPSTRSYFASATYNKLSSILAPSGSATADRTTRLFASYLYLALRPYLARSLRMRALSDYKSASGVEIDDDAVMSAVNEYLVSVYDEELYKPNEWITENLVYVYDRFLSALPKSLPVMTALHTITSTCLASTCDTSTVQVDDGGPKDGEDQQSLQRVASQTQKDEEGEGSEGDGQGDDGQGDSEGEEGDEDGDGESEGDSDDGDDGDEGQEDGSGEGESKSDSTSENHGAGSQSNGFDTESEPKDLNEALEQASQQAAEQATQDDSARREMENLRQATSAGMFSQPLKGRKQTPGYEYVLMQKQMAREFGKIMEDADPGFMTHQPSGRVSMKRAMHGIEDYDTAFDVWDEGKLSAASMEVVLLVDNSGSMYQSMTEACQSAWAIARGIESLGDSARVTTIFFNSDSGVTKRASEREGPQYTFVGDTGGTYPASALLDAQRIFVESSRNHKLCIILTDGAWTGAGIGVNHASGDELTDNDVVIQKMQSKNVKVSIANMFPEYQYQGYSKRMNLDHGADTVTRVNGPKDFVAFARSIVKEAMSK